jgi:hypothetical protein
VFVDDAERFQGTERFHVVRRLGEGAFGVVLEVIDREHDAVVALKVLRTQAPDAIARFKGEFRALADLSHPNLVRYHELAFDGSRWFFTMERVRGTTLLEYACGPAAAGPAPARADPARLRHVLAQLAAGLDALHESGRLHRDVKPSNALVTDEGRVVLLDFGLVTELGAPEAGLMGTPAYMSPEQALGKSLGRASDMYSVGVILFEALAGSLPFPGSGWEGLAAKVVREAPDVGTLAPGAPEDLRELCRELLTVDPERRPSAREVVRRLAPEHEPVSSFPSSSRVPFVGRERETAALREALGAVQAGEARIVWVRGPSGVGKSALVRRFLDEARSAGAMVLTGRCYEQERLPYKTLDGVVDALVQRWSTHPERRAEELAPNDAGVLSRLFQTFWLLPETAASFAAVEGEPLEIRRRAFAALRETLSRIAQRERLVVFVDDLHWGDVDGAQLLADILRTPAPPLLFVGAYRRDERRSSPALRVLAEALERHGSPRAVEVDLSAMSPDESVSLAAAIVPGPARIPREALDELVRESAGLPFLLGELVRLAALEGAGARPSHEDATVTTTVERVVGARLVALPPEARELLQVLAVAGQPVPRSLVREVGGVADEPTAFSALRAAGLVRTTGPQGMVEPYHDRIRETVLSSLSARGMRDLHLRLGAALEAQADVEPERVAHHYDAAGESVPASTWTERAADRAFDALAFERAARLYARTVRLLGVRAERGHLVRLLGRQGDALADAGRSAEAADAYSSAAACAEGDAALNLERKSAEHLLRAGLVERGEAATRALLARLGIGLPRGKASLLVRLVASRVRLALRGLDCGMRPEPECGPRDLLRVDTCSAMALALSGADPFLAAYAHARALRTALDVGEPSRVHRALLVEATQTMVFGSPRRLQDLRERIRALTPDASGLATRALDFFDAIHCYFRGQWRESFDRLHDLERYLTEECRGVTWELGVVRSYLLASQYLLGDLRGLLPRIDALVEDAEARGDVIQEVTLRMTYTSFAALVRGDPAFAHREIARGLARWGRQGFTVPHYWAAYGEVETSLYERDGALAWRKAEALWRRYRRNPSSRVEYLRALTVYLHGRAALACARSVPDERVSRVAFARRAAERLDRTSIPWARAASRLLTAGATALSGGERANIESALEEAIACCETGGFRLYEEIARRALAVHRGDAVALETAERWLRDAGVEEPARLAYAFAPEVAT